MFVNKEAVGKRILQIRKKYGYSMQKFGEIIDNAPKGSVNSWEKGVNLPNEKRLKQIATLGNMTLNELLYGSFKEYVDMLITEKLGIELPEEFTRTFYSLLEQNGFTYGDDIEIVRLVNGFLTYHNLTTKETAIFYQPTAYAYGQYGYSPEELDAALVSANADLQDSTAKLKALDAAIREKKELQTQVLAYAKTKPARDGLKAQKSEKARRAYREQHESDFIIADTAARYFREHGITKLPASKALQREIEQLTVQKNAGYNDYREKRQRAQELQTVRRNIDQILRGAPSQQKKREQER